MKVVLFCGGLGTRLREYSDTIPKPLVTIGYRPILWHLMKYYAHFGHNDFILCLGYRGDLIKDYFLNYNECMSNDFVDVATAARRIELLNSDIDDWKITFVDTGLALEHRPAAQGGRAPTCDGEEMFLANYSDGLSDLPLGQYIDDFKAPTPSRRFLSVAPLTVVPQRARRRRRSRQRHPARPRHGLPDQRRLLRASRTRSSSTCRPARSSSKSRSTG